MLLYSRTKKKMTIKSTETKRGVNVAPDAVPVPGDGRASARRVSSLKAVDGNVAGGNGVVQGLKAAPPYFPLNGFCFQTDFSSSKLEFHAYYNVYSELTSTLTPFQAVIITNQGGMRE